MVAGSLSIHVNTSIRLSHHLLPWQRSSNLDSEAGKVETAFGVLECPRLVRWLTAISVIDYPDSHGCQETNTICALESQRLIITGQTSSL